MAISPSPNRSPKRVTSPQIKDQTNKKKKVKRNLDESQENLDSIQQVPQSSVPSAPRKRTKDPGVRVVGGRIYDSENGKTCHQCRQKTMDFVAACKSRTDDKPCKIKFCHKCLLNRYGEKAEEMDQLNDWKCPKCRGICNCSFCMKKRGHQPTGILVHTAKKTGYQSVSEMLTGNGPKNVGASPKKVSALIKEENSTEGQDDFISHPKSLTSPSDGKKVKERKRKKLEHGNASDNVVDGGEKKLKAKRNKSKKLAPVKSEVNVQEGSKENGVQSEKNTKEPSISIEASSNSIQDEKEKINETGDIDRKKPKKSRASKKITLDPINTQGNGGKDNLEDKPKLTIDCKIKTERDAEDVDTPLPQGISLTTVADIEVPAVDVGPALQFLQFCNAFEKILELKKGQPESVLRELTSGCGLRRRQYSSVVRFHVQLLSLIQKDVGEECPLSPTSNGSSWLQALGKCISKSQCALKDMPLECFDRGSDGYEKLNSSEKLRLLNFLCDEVLCTTELREWIDKQNEQFVKKGKEAKEKVLAAKDKERHLKQQKKDEFAKAILLKNGAPLSISEHADLVSKIKTEAAKAHAEKLEAIGMVPKKKQRSDAVRTEPVLLNENGLIFWRLRSCSTEPTILLQDVGRWDSDKPEDKWFTYDTEQKKAVDNYISSQRKKRLRLKVLPDACIERRENHKE